MTSQRSTQRPPVLAGKPRFRWGFLSEVIAELRKVVWPTREEANRLTMMVIVVSLVVGAALGVIDIGFSEFIRILT